MIFNSHDITLHTLKIYKTTKKAKSFVPGNKNKKLQKKKKTRKVKVNGKKFTKVKQFFFTWKRNTIVDIHYLHMHIKKLIIIILNQEQFN